MRKDQFPTQVFNMRADQSFELLLTEMSWLIGVYYCVCVLVKVQGHSLSWIVSLILILVQILNQY